MAFGKCGQVWRVPQMAEFWRMQVWQVFKMLLASLANLGTYISQLVLCTKHFYKLAKFAKFANFAIVLANSSLASTTKGHSLANSSLASRQFCHSFGEFEFGKYYEGSQFGEFESGESERFPKMAILASTQICQKLYYKSYIKKVIL